MNYLDELLARAIPIDPGTCGIIRGKKEWLRQQMRERLQQGKDLHLVPDWVINEYKNFTGETVGN